MQKGKLLVISGPSAGVGKDTILNMFRAAHPDWKHSLSTTTRLPRQGETDGVQMNFIDRPTFEAWNREGKFLEVFEVAGNLYGTLREPVEQFINSGQNIVLRKDVQGALAIKKALPGSMIVMIVPDSWEALESRIRGRATDDETTITRRLSLAKEEMRYKDQFDHIIVNPTGHPEQALADLEKTLILNDPHP